MNIRYDYSETFVDLLKIIPLNISVHMVTQTSLLDTFILLLSTYVLSRLKSRTDEKLSNTGLYVMTNAPTVNLYTCLSSQRQRQAFFSSFTVSALATHPFKPYNFGDTLKHAPSF